MAESTLTPEERQKIYDEEKARIEAREKIEKEKEEEENRPTQPIKGKTVVVVLLLCGLFVYFCIAMNQISSSTPPTPTRPDELSPSTIGAEARIQFGDGQYPAWVSEDEQTYKELVAAVTAKDTIGYNKLLYSGKVFEVATGTKVLVLESGLERAKVRILEGDNSGRSGWVPRQGVH